MKTRAASTKPATHTKSVNVSIFNSKGVFSGKDEMEFDSRFNRPRKTFMPDAVTTFKDKVRSGDVGSITGIAQTLNDDPGSYVLLDDRHGFPILLKAEDLRIDKG